MLGDYFSDWWVSFSYRFGGNKGSYILSFPGCAWDRWWCHHHSWRLLFSSWHFGFWYVRWFRRFRDLDHRYILLLFRYFLNWFDHILLILLCNAVTHHILLTVDQTLLLFLTLLFLLLIDKLIIIHILYLSDIELTLIMIAITDSNMLYQHTITRYISTEYLNSSQMIQLWLPKLCWFHLLLISRMFVDIN